MTREQESAVSDLAAGIAPDARIDPGPVQVDEGYEDGVVFATTFGHREYRITQGGVVTFRGFNNSVDWTVLTS